MTDVYKICFLLIGHIVSVCKNQWSGISLIVIFYKKLFVFLLIIHITFYLFYKKNKPRSCNLHTSKAASTSCISQKLYISSSPPYPTLSLDHIGWLKKRPIGSSPGQNTYRTTNEYEIRWNFGLICINYLIVSLRTVLVYS